MKYNLSVFNTDSEIASFQCLHKIANELAEMNRLKRLELRNSVNVVSFTDETELKDRAV